MGNPTYRIPKLTDEEIVAALGRIREGLVKIRQFKIMAHPTHAGGILVDPVKPTETSALKFIFDLHSRSIPMRGSRVRAATVDLAQPWTQIRDRLLQHISTR